MLDTLTAILIYINIMKVVMTITKVHTMKNTITITYEFIELNFNLPKKLFFISDFLIKEPIHYKFGYSVHDPHTGDKKEAWEHRSGDDVKGKFWLLEFLEFLSTKNR